MGGDGTAIDLSVFSSPTGGQLPGKYIVDIYINDELADHREVEFIADKSTSGKDKNGTKNNEEITGLIPCLTLEDLKGYGLRTDAIEAFNKNSEDKSAAEQVDNAKAKVNSPAVEGACSNILQSIPAAKADFDFNKQRLNLSIPQALMSHSARGYVDPKFWDDGITAALIDYNFTGANGTSSGDNSKDDSYYLNLRSGLNLGAWRLRNYSAWNDNNGVREWQNINTYLQRSIISIKSQLILGDNYSSADILIARNFGVFKLHLMTICYRIVSKVLRLLFVVSRRPMRRSQLLRMDTPYTRVMFHLAHLRLMTFIRVRVAAT